MFSVDDNAIMDGGIRIDPTNANLNLKDEINKLINKQHIKKKKPPRRQG